VTAIELFEASASPAHGGRTSPTAARPRANPLALIELPLAGQPATRRGDPLPLIDRLAQPFAARFAELPESAGWLLLVAAVDKEEKVSEVLRAGGLAFGSGTLASDGLEPAADAAVVELEVQTVRFRYPLMRSAVLVHAGLRHPHRVHEVLAATLGEPWPVRCAITRRCSSVSTRT